MSNHEPLNKNKIKALLIYHSNSKGNDYYYVASWLKSDLEDAVAGLKEELLSIESSYGTDDVIYLIDKWLSPSEAGQSGQGNLTEEQEE